MVGRSGYGAMAASGWLHGGWVAMVQWLFAFTDEASVAMVGRLDVGSQRGLSGRGWSVAT